MWGVGGVVGPPPLGGLVMTYFRPHGLPLLFSAAFFGLAVALKRLPM